MDIQQDLKNLPRAPGVYLFKDAQGRIIYIGKAKSLKQRVESYFKRPADQKTQAMVSKIARITYQVTASESQAEILEASLIKENQPQYNIDLKDDKSFPWIRIAQGEFPLVCLYRRKGAKLTEQALYFGPYTNVKLLRQAFKMMRRIFGFRSCKILPKKPCLYYRLKLCPAPCAGKISRRDYYRLIKQIELFLESKYAELLTALSQEMQKLSGEKRFEEAAAVRDRIQALSAMGENARPASSQYELEDLKKIFKLKRLPLRIEAFDISNICGREATGSLVSFYRGKADKNNYRRFRIKAVTGINDYEMLQEVLQRRYLRLKREHLALPDLILIDGGKGHLCVAKDILEKLGLDIPLVSIAKDRENIYLKDASRPLRLKEDSPALNLIRRVRDEAHRFALKYHHLLHKKKTIGK